MKLPTHWTTKDKRSIPIKEMTDSHLANTIAYLERTAPAKQEIAQESAMIGYGALRGDMAKYYAGQELNDLFVETPDQWLARQPAYKALVKEQKRRLRRRRADVTRQSSQP